MDELIVRFAAGIQALFGLGLFVAGLGALGSDPPGTALGWAVAVVGAGLVAAMVVTGLGLALGEPVPISRAASVLVAGLAAGLIGAFLMQLPSADFA